MILLVVIICNFQLMLSQELSPYIKVGVTTNGMQQAYNDVVKALAGNGFKVLGSYHPAKKKSLKVLVFTRSDLQNTVVKVQDRGALAAAQKIGFQRKNGQIIISYTNPDYMLRAYLRDDYNKYKRTFDKFHSDLKSALSVIGNDFTPFGGKVSANKLKKYHYKIMMPYFTDPVELKNFSSYKEGEKTILSNLERHKSGTKLVYKLSYPSKNITVFGVALYSNDSASEAYFLPRIGEEHIAALPYEIILQGNQATMLHGKYRFALFWPKLSMGQFMKIMSTPGKIEDILKSLCE